MSKKMMEISLERLRPYVEGAAEELLKTAIKIGTEHERSSDLSHIESVVAVTEALRHLSQVLREGSGIGEPSFIYSHDFEEGGVH